MNLCSLLAAGLAALGLGTQLFCADSCRPAHRPFARAPVRLPGTRGPFLGGAAASVWGQLALRPQKTATATAQVAAPVGSPVEGVAGWPWAGLRSGAGM